MSHSSLKEQLQAVAAQLSTTKVNKNQLTNEKSVIDKSKKNHKAKPKWLEYVQYGVELLRVYFPGCFKSHDAVKPLKKGIKEDLVRRLSTIAEIVTEDKACMVKSLSYYVNTIAYHKSVVEGAMRVDLEGNTAEVVTAEEAKYSVLRQQTKLHSKEQSTT